MISVVDQRVQLGPDLRLPAGPGVLDLLVDQAHQRLAQVDRGESASFSSRSGRA